MKKTCATYYILRTLTIALVCATLPELLISDDSTVVAPNNSKRGLATLAAIFGSLQAEGALLTGSNMPALGIGHFVQGEWLDGTAFLGGELTLMFLESKLKGKVEPVDISLYPYVSNDSFFRRQPYSPSSDSYAQLADITHLALWNTCLIEVFSTYRSLHQKATPTTKISLEDSPASLMLSPFKPIYLINPWVILPPIITGTAMYLKSKRDRTISSARQITLFNSPSVPSKAALLFAQTNAFEYLMVAAGEEMFYRGVIQTEFDEYASPAVGIGASSLIFGLSHIPNHDFNRGLAATLIGFYLGWRYVASDYDLGEPIAIHFWWDFTINFMDFLLNPRNTNRVYSISWRI